MTDTYMIELDVSHEASEAQVIAEAVKYNCEATLVQAFGPAGGNPVYIFSSNDFEDLHSLASVILDTEDQSWVDSMIEMYDEDGDLV